MNDSKERVLIATSGKRVEALKSVIIRLAEGLDVKHVIVLTTRGSVESAKIVADDNDIKKLGITISTDYELGYGNLLELEDLVNQGEIGDAVSKISGIVKRYLVEGYDVIVDVTCGTKLTSSLVSIALLNCSGTIKNRKDRVLALSYLTGVGSAPWWYERAYPETPRVFQIAIVTSIPYGNLLSVACRPEVLEIPRMIRLPKYVARRGLKPLLDSIADVTKLINSLTCGDLRVYVIPRGSKHELLLLNAKHLDSKVSIEIDRCLRDRSYAKKFLENLVEYTNSRTSEKVLIDLDNASRLLVELIELAGFKKLVVTDIEPRTDLIEPGDHLVDVFKRLMESRSKSVELVVMDTCLAYRGIHNDLIEVFGTASPSRVFAPPCALWEALAKFLETVKHAYHSVSAALNSTLSSVASIVCDYHLRKDLEVHWRSGGRTCEAEILYNIDILRGRALILTADRGAYQGIAGASDVYVALLEPRDVDLEELSKARRLAALIQMISFLTLALLPFADIELEGDRDRVLITGINHWDRGYAEVHKQST